MFPLETERRPSRLRGVAIGAVVSLALIAGLKLFTNEDGGSKKSPVMTEAWIELTPDLPSQERIRIIGRSVCSLESDKEINQVLMSMVGIREYGNILRLKRYYRAFERHTGLPWQLAAAIHFRESGASESLDLQAGNPYGGPYSQWSDSYEKYGHPRNLTESLYIMAKEFEAKNSTGKPIGLPHPNQDAIRDALFGYNGRNKDYKTSGWSRGYVASFEGSPYVTNLFDEKRGYGDRRNVLKMVSNDFGPVDAPDNRPGAYTVYTLLKGPGSCLDNKTIEDQNNVQS